MIAMIINCHFLNTVAFKNLPNCVQETETKMSCTKIVIKQKCVYSYNKYRSYSKNKKIKMLCIICMPALLKHWLVQYVCFAMQYNQ